MANSLYEMSLQGIMVVVFIILDWIFVSWTQLQWFPAGTSYRGTCHYQYEIICSSFLQIILLLYYNSNLIFFKKCFQIISLHVHTLKFYLLYGLLAEQARWTKFCTVIGYTSWQKKCSFSHKINPLLTKLVRSRYCGLILTFFFFGCLWTVTPSQWTHK